MGTNLRLKIVSLVWVGSFALVGSELFDSSAYAASCTCSSFASTQSFGGSATTQNPNTLAGGTNVNFMTLQTKVLPPSITYSGNVIDGIDKCWGACSSSPYANGGYVYPCGPNGSDIPSGGSNAPPGAYRCFEWMSPNNSPEAKLAVSNACQAFNKTSGQIYVLVGANYNNGQAYYSQDFYNVDCGTWNPSSAPASTGAKGTASGITSITSYSSGVSEGGHPTVGGTTISGNLSVDFKAIPNGATTPQDGVCASGLARKRMKALNGTFSYVCN